jgi:hypothetical protein
MKKQLNTLIILLLLSGTYIFAQDYDEWLTTDNFSYPVKELDMLEMNFSYGLGSLIIEPNSDSNMLEGSITYNSHELFPKVDYEIYESTGIFEIDVKNRDYKYKRKHQHDDYDDDDYDYDDDDDDHYKWDFDFDDLRFGKLKDKYENDMVFSLPTSTETDLVLDFGLGSAELDLSGLRIINFEIDCGLSEVDIVVNESNPIRCKTVNISNGLGDLTADGLGNLRAKRLSFDVGLGSANIDLRGDDISDMQVDIDVGLGSMDLVLPENANIKIYVEGSFLSSINVLGLVKKKKKEWSSPKWKSSRPTIELEVSVGMGSVNIRVDD